MTYQVHFEPADVTVTCEPGTTLVEAAHQAGVAIQAVCGGQGRCSKCQVRIADSPVAAPGSLEEQLIPAELLAQGYRLACRYQVQRDMTVECLSVSTASKRQTPGELRPAEPGPVIWRHGLGLTPPTLEAPVDDTGNLLAALSAAGTRYEQVDVQVVRTLPEVLRAGRWAVTASGRGGEVVAVRPTAEAGPPLGLAVDLGTTNIAVYLYHLDSGELLEIASATNPLITYGADILSRLGHAQRSPANAARLQGSLVKTLNLLAHHVSRRRGYQTDQIDEMVVVGNSGMHHLFCNLASRQLTHAPYVPATRRPMSIKAREFGLEISPGAYVYLPPLVAGYIGSDLVAAALACRIDREPGNWLLVDIGTNTEVLLSVDGQLYGCSCASGPALEGAALRFGSMAMPGVIDWVGRAQQGSGWHYHTIGNKPAIGICGSGIIDALAAMAGVGIINYSGRLQLDAPNVTPGVDGNREWTVVPAPETNLGQDLTISQQDVREIQLAKGAIRAGIETLMAEHNLQPGDLNEILIAGAFGNYLRVESALEIGLFPPVEPAQVRQIGNAAGVGAGLMLLSTAERAAAEALSEQVRYLELSTHPRFKRLFVQGQRFGEPAA